MTIQLTWEKPPTKDDPRVPTKTEIAEALRERPGQWAVVGRHDRIVRADAQTDRIKEGSEFGPGFTAVRRRVGNQHVVYAKTTYRRVVKIGKGGSA